MEEKESANSKNMKDVYKISLIFDVIKRYDNYIISTNAKASLIIAFNSLILGTALIKFSDIISFYDSLIIKWIVGVILTLISASSLLSLFFVFNVVYPYFGSTTDEENQDNSLIYFGSVSKMGAKEYLEYLKSKTIEELSTDLAEQATILASGLIQKMRKMRQSINAIIFNLALIMLLIILRVVKFL